MEKRIAKYVAREAFLASTRLGDLIPFLKKHCSPDDFEKLRKPIVTVAASIGLDILNLIFSELPDLKREFDEDIKKYGDIL